MSWIGDPRIVRGYGDRKFGHRELPSSLSDLGHSRRFEPTAATSGLPRRTDVPRIGGHVSKVPTSDLASKGRLDPSGGCRLFMRYGGIVQSPQLSRPGGA